MWKYICYVAAMPPPAAAGAHRGLQQLVGNCDIELGGKNGASGRNTKAPSLIEALKPNIQGISCGGSSSL